MKRYAKGLTVLLAVMAVFVLAACNSGSTNGSGIPKNPGNVYRVITVDESGTPVKGANIQLCTDVLCYSGETDGNGIATFEGVDEGVYSIHVLKAPDGFAADETEYETPSTFGDVTITLKAA